MDDCGPEVLAAVLDFIYGAKIPEGLSKEDLESLLAMSDLYLMEDLKDAVGLVIFNEVTSKDNVAEISKFSVRYQAKGLQKNCCQFLLPTFITAVSSLLTT